MNGSPKTSVNTAVNTVLTHAPGKTRVYLQKTGYTREIPGSASMPRAPYSQGPAPPAARTACSSTRTAPCALATSAKRHGLQVAVRTMRSCRHSASSATLGRGLHRRVDPLAERPQGALAAHAAGYASRQGLPQKYSPSRLLLASTQYRTPPTSAPAVCIACSAVCRCILVLEDQLACSTSKRPIVAVHRAAASLSTAQRARGRVPCGWRDNSGVWTLVALLQRIRARLARI